MASTMRLLTLCTLIGTPYMFNFHYVLGFYVLIKSFTNVYRKGLQYPVTNTRMRPGLTLVKDDNKKLHVPYVLLTRTPEVRPLVCTLRWSCTKLVYCVMSIARILTPYYNKFV